jgi:hypothetical protein
MGKTLKSLLVIGITSVVVGAGFLTFRNKAIDRLYAEAAGYPEYFSSNTASTNAVRSLAAYHGSRATEKLIQIALGEGPLVFGDVQAEAIKALGERNDAEVVPTLTSLLQPHQALGIRLAAADALRSVACDGLCVRSLLHYLERVWRGEKNEEDRRVFPPGTELLRDAKLQEQRTLYEALHSVLRRANTETLRNLEQTYGLGSANPSPFALDLLGRLELREACPLLLRTDRIVRESPSGIYTDPPKELQTAIGSLKCQ